MEFEKLGLDHRVLRALREMGFSAPTPIQKQALPLLLQGEDLIGQAQTGTGKTAAFGICIIEHLLASSHKPGATKALVLAPTRELAVQIAEEIRKIGKYAPFRVIAVFGGQSIEQQISQLQQGADVVVGTPGRLLDHIERKTIQLGGVEIVVLDEADRMLDMGFIDDIEKILSQLPQKRQTLLFSATMPKEILELSRKYLKTPQEILVSEDLLSAGNIKQYYVETSKFDRLNVLLFLLATKKPELALVFTRTKRGAERLNEILQDRGFASLALHGDMTQKKRDFSMDAFRKKDIKILVATDLASRGLDVSGVTHVFNFEMTEDPYVYLHRIGRTGRMGKEGEAISLVTFDQASLIPIIEKVTGSKMERLEVDVKPELLPKRIRFASGRKESRHKQKPRSQGSRKEARSLLRGGHYFGRGN